MSTAQFTSQLLYCLQLYYDIFIYPKIRRKCCRVLLLALCRAIFSFLRASVLSRVPIYLLDSSFLGVTQLRG